jgi:putative transposase
MLCPPLLRVLNPSQQFGNLFNAYAKAINKAYQRTGSLFENPFGRILVTSDAYFVRLVTYIHQNPQKHRFMDDFRDWHYSSYHALLSQQATRLKRDEVLAWFQGSATFQAMHQQIVSERQLAALVPDDFD